MTQRPPSTVTAARVSSKPRAAHGDIPNRESRSRRHHRHHEKQIQPHAMTGFQTDRTPGHELPTNRAATRP